MRPSIKVALVAGGYLAAFLIASAVVAVRIAATSGPVAQASSGMYAAGDAMLVVAVFGVTALVPTGAALFFLRPYQPFWILLSVTSVLVAITGVAAAILFAVGRTETASLLATLAGISVPRILPAPLLAITFAVCAAFSPHRSARLALLAATALEFGVSLYGGLTWFVPLLFPGR